jgi:hypothetical protein
MRLALLAIALLSTPADATAVDSAGRMPSGYLRLVDQVPLPPAPA